MGEREPFRSGREAGAAFYREVVGPLLGRARPGLGYAAGRLGAGSDVLGLDDATSRDHDWGLRLTLLVDEADAAQVPALLGLLEAELPDRFAGYPVRFPASGQAGAGHWVEVATVGGFARRHLGLSPLDGLTSLDWLTLTGQSVLEVTAGPVFADSTTELARVRRALEWYPADVARYVIGCGWQRVSQRLPFVGRSADTGQPVQSRLLTAGLASDLISLAFLVHQAWEPYEKWRQARLALLPGAAPMTAALEAALTADDGPGREAGLAAAIELVAAAQRESGLPVPDPVVQPFWDRPYRTVSDDLAGLLLGGITDPVLRRLGVRAGSVGQWADSVDVLADAQRRTALGAAYHHWLDHDHG